jgi:tripartite-type tricarboxylate transporter receptor subunit TctC
MNILKFVIFFICLAVQAIAQPLSARTIHFVVPFAAGGTTDVTARILAQELSKNENISVVVENRPGALGSIGANYVLSQRPDGSVLLFTSNGILANRYFSNNKDVDVIDRLIPVASVIESAMVMMVANNIPVTNGREFVSLMQSRPNHFHYGTSAGGGTLQIAASLFLRASNTDMIAVPYSGGSTAATDLLGGRIALMFDSNLVGMQHHRAGTARALAVTSRERSRSIPDIPTWKEIGIDADLYASNNTPIEVLQALNRMINNTLRTSTTTNRFLETGADRVMNESLEQLSSRVSQELKVLEITLTR